MQYLIHLVNAADFVGERRPRGAERRPPRRQLGGDAEEVGALGLRMRQRSVRTWGSMN